MDNENNEFQSLLDEKRHKELITVLKKILINLDNKTEVDNSMDVENLLRSISSKQNDNSVPSSIIAIGNAIVNKIDEIKTSQLSQIVQKDEWEFIVNRNMEGFITSIIAK